MSDGSLIWWSFVIWSAGFVLGGLLWFFIGLRVGKQIAIEDLAEPAKPAGRCPCGAEDDYPGLGEMVDFDGAQWHRLCVPTIIRGLGDDGPSDSDRR